MKTRLFTGAAAIVASIGIASTAQAATCTLAGSALPMSVQKSTTPEQIVSDLKKSPNYNARDCPQDELLGKILEINPGWTVSTVVTTDVKFSVPLLVTVPLQATTVTTTAPATVTTTVTPGAVAAPVAPAPLPRVAAASAAVDNSAEVRRAQDRITALQREHAVLQRALAQRPKVTWTKAELDRLNGFTNAIAKAEKDIAALKAAVALKADKSYVDTQLGLKADAANVYSKTYIDDKFNALPAANNGWTWWDWAVAIGALLALLIAGVAVFFALAAAGRPIGVISSDVDTKIKDALKDMPTKADLMAAKTDASAFQVVADDVEGLKTQVASLTSRYEHTLERITVGDELTLAPAEIRALSDGTIFQYPVLVDGEVVTFGAEIVGHTPSGDALVKVSELRKTVPAKTLFSAIAKHVETGGRMPPPTVAAAA